MEIFVTRLFFFNWHDPQNWFPKMTLLYCPFLQKVSNQLSVKLYRLSIYHSVYNQLIRTLFEAQSADPNPFLGTHYTLPIIWQEDWTSWFARSIPACKNCQISILINLKTFPLKIRSFLAAAKTHRSYPPVAHTHGK